MIPDSSFVAVTGDSVEIGRTVMRRRVAECGA